MCRGGCGSYFRGERKFKISARSDKPFRRSSADTQNFHNNRTTFNIDTLLVWNDPREMGGCQGGCGELFTSGT